MDKGEEFPSLTILLSLEEFLLWLGEYPVTPDRCAGLVVATESPRLSPALACTLHLLFTLSDRFIIALCTKPPSPLVGDGGRPAEDRILEVLPRPGESPSAVLLKSSGLNDGRSKTGDFDERDIIEAGLAEPAWSPSGSWCRGRVETVLRGEGGGVGFWGSLLATTVESFDMPGSLTPRFVKGVVVS